MSLSNNAQALSLVDLGKEPGSLDLTFFMGQTKDHRKKKNVIYKEKSSVSMTIIILFQLLKHCPLAITQWLM